MSVLELIATGTQSDASLRPLLLVLLVLAILFLLTGAILALVALRSQRKKTPELLNLEKFDNEIN